MKMQRNNWIRPRCFKDEATLKTLFLRLNFIRLEHISLPDAAVVSQTSHVTPTRQFHGQAREGFGGEKAAQGVASLPVPPIHGTLPQSNMPTRIRTGSAPAKGSGNAKGSFRKKAGRALVFPRLYSHRPAPAVELSPTDDPTWHRHPAGRRGDGGRRTRPPPLSHELR